MVKVGINGFGRIGRNVLRAALNNPDIQIVAINDLTDSKTLAHLLKYDSLLGKLDAEVTAGEGGLVVDGKPITVFSERNPASIPWRQCEVDIVIEATGLFTDREKAAVHIHSGGAKRVIISAPGKNDDLTIVMGVNESLYSPDKHYVISNGSCTTNGLAPAAQVLHQHFGIHQIQGKGEVRQSLSTWKPAALGFSTPFNFSWRFCLWSRWHSPFECGKRSWHLFDNHVCG